MPVFSLGAPLGIAPTLQPHATALPARPGDDTSVRARGQAAA